MAKSVKKAVKKDASVIRKFQLHGDARKDEEGRDGIKYGVTTGLNITHFLNELFLQNYDDQLSDPELDAICREEFPNRTSFQDMSAYRGYFNGFKHGFGTGEPLQGDQRLVRFKSEEEEAVLAESRAAKKAAKAAEQEDEDEEEEEEEEEAPPPKSKVAPKKAAPVKAAPAKVAASKAPVSKAPVKKGK